MTSESSRPPGDGSFDPDGFDYTSHYTIDAENMPMPEELRHFRRWQERRRITLIAGLFPPMRGKRILDVGCGSGWLSGVLSRRGMRVFAADIGYDSVARADARLKERGEPVSFTVGDIYRLPFADGAFDAVVASEVLEHLPDPSRAAAELSRVVRPGGIAVVSTPYRERIESTLCIHCNRATPVNAHLHSFDEHSLGAVMSDGGFTVERCVRFACGPAEILGLPGLTAAFPYGVWRTLDAAACLILGRQSFMAIKAVRRD